MKNSTSFWTSVLFAIMMVLCIIMDINTINSGIADGKTSSIIGGTVALTICVIALICNIITIVKCINDD